MTKSTQFTPRKSMIPALLSGAQTQVRFVMRHQPPNNTYSFTTCLSTTGDARNEGRHQWMQIARLGDPFEPSSMRQVQPYFSCPYGTVDGEIWLRESWGYHVHAQGSSRDEDGPFVYEADGPFASQQRLCESWRPALSMARWASRGTFSVKQIRVERLNSISKADAMAEGIIEFERDGCALYGLSENDPQAWHCPVGRYAKLWDKRNGAGAWEKNPYVWVLEIKRVTPVEPMANSSWQSERAEPEMA